MQDGATFRMDTMEEKALPTGRLPKPRTPHSPALTQNTGPETRDSKLQRKKKYSLQVACTLYHKPETQKPELKPEGKAPPLQVACSLYHEIEAQNSKRKTQNPKHKLKTPEPPNPKHNPKTPDPEPRTISPEPSRLPRPWSPLHIRPPKSSVPKGYLAHKTPPLPVRPYSSPMHRDLH